MVGHERRCSNRGFHGAGRRAKAITRCGSAFGAPEWAPMTKSSPSAAPGTPAALKELADKWNGAKAAERANAQSYIIDLCHALDVEPPRPAGSGYEFELPVKLIARDGSESQGFIDCYKAGHFVLEAKDYEEGRSNDVLLRKAFGQARMYASHDPAGVAPPYLLVLDVGKTMLVWDRWSGTFGGYASARRIDLTTLHERPDDAALLVDIWTDPSVRNPRLTAQLVTREIAEHLAELAASLEGRGIEQDRVARFLMRCVFTMFAEDVGLLPDEPFRRLLDEIAMPSPAEFPGAAEELWHAMDEGRRFGFRKLLRFNGHFFKDAEALPLTREDLATLLEAAKADWSRVEPTIFGTLLTRALDPVERHRLGAEYTPPEFIERLVLPTVEEPIRERWTAVQTQVLQIKESLKRPSAAQMRAPAIRKKFGQADKRMRAKALEPLTAFHAWLRQLRFLDPACGSGNFLYVTMHAVKRIEVEVLHEMSAVRGGAQDLRFEEVDPSQFLGLEVNQWAREIAELTLWIGFHQFWRQHHGDVQPEEPLLRDTGTLECRDAVLAWDEKRRDPARDRPDPTSRLRHAATGEMVPDPAAKLEYVEYVNPHEAKWPQADFIIGNPPYLGEKRQREVFGDGYVDALRAAYPDVSDSADFVTYWWYRAAREVAEGRAIRAGLITTNTLTQSKNRTVIRSAAESGARVMWAVADHPWIEDTDGAAVRVAMTVIAKDPPVARAVFVDDSARELRVVTVPRLNDDLSTDADVPSAALVPLMANASMSHQGFKVGGEGFICTEEEAADLIARDPRNREILRPFRNGRDLSGKPRGVWIIDFGLCDEAEAKQYPLLYDRLRDRVKPERAANKRESYRRLWWRFLEPRRELREALRGLSRYIVTLEVSKHRFFTWLEADTAPDGALVCIASEEDYDLGILSSTVHATWALAAGGRLGVGNDPRYNKTLCFDAFPFPDAPAEQQKSIAEAAAAIEAHRARVLTSNDVTMTGLYNVVEKLRNGEQLTTAERQVHSAGACATLLDLHNDLDRAVASAYGWAWPLPRAAILEQLVALHDERVAQERAGRVQWLRPEYQSERLPSASAGTRKARKAAEASSVADIVQVQWPGDVIGQITALRQLIAAGPVSAEEAAAHFNGASKPLIKRHLETLAILGEVRAVANGRYAPAFAAA